MAGFDSGAEYQLDVIRGLRRAEALAGAFDMFERGAVKLCHPHCAKFCVLGGGSCSA